MLQFFTLANRHALHALHGDMEYSIVRLLVSICPHTCAVKSFAVSFLLKNFPRVGGGESSATTGTIFHEFFTAQACKQVPICGEIFRPLWAVPPISPGLYRCCRLGSIRPGRVACVRCGVLRLVPFWFPTFGQIAHGSK